VTERLAAEVRGSRRDGDREGRAVSRSALQPAGREEAARCSSCTRGRGDERTGGGGPGVSTRRRPEGESRDGGGLEPPRRDAAQGSRGGAKESRCRGSTLYLQRVRFNPLLKPLRSSKSRVDQIESTRNKRGAKGS
jgi:hypothetical protein